MDYIYFFFVLFLIIIIIKRNKFLILKKNTKVIIITSIIRAGKTKLANYLVEYLQNRGDKVILRKKVSLQLERELDIYYKVLKENPKDQSIVLFYQYIIINKYKEYIDSIKFENYDYVILDHSHLDTIFFYSCWY